MVKINYINWGIASRVGKNVYMNWRLKSYPRLRNALLKHEKGHTDDFTIKDFIHDVEVKDIKGLKQEYYKFIIQNPTSWVEYLPIKKYGNTLLFNVPLSVIWILGIVMIWLIIINIK